MKKLILFLSIIWTVSAFGQATVGFHRVNQLLQRGTSGTYAQIVPRGTVQVTSTATRLLATIYRDPLLTSQITSGSVTSDANGNYDYYIPLNYCVDETVSSPGAGSYTTTNICGNTESAVGLFATPPVLGSTTPNVVNGTDGNFSGNVAAGTMVTAPAVTANAINASVGSTVPVVIHDDDCSGDPDCLFTDVMLQHWVDVSQVNVIAIIADSGNPDSAPIRHIFSSYFGRSSAAIPIGAWQGADVPGGSSTSLWTPDVKAQFDPGDTRANYPSCLTTYRTVLASAASSSVTIVGTGFATCIVSLIQSPADGISALTGAQLVQAKVKALVLMGGQYPSGTESNFNHDPVNFSTLFAAWTSQNGYPPVYLLGNQVPWAYSGTPLTWPSTSPSRWAQINESSSFPQANTSDNVDQLALLYAVFANSTGQWTLSANGTNTVNSSTGSNTWSSTTASGHYYLSFSASSNVNNTVQTAMDFLPANLVSIIQAYDGTTGNTTSVTGDQVTSPKGIFGGGIFQLFGTMNVNAGGMLPSTSTGGYNTASGYYTLQNNTTGIGNSAFGQGPLIANTTGSENSAFGRNALFSNSTGSYNTASGWEALFSNTTGSSNSAHGVEAMLNNTTGGQNAAFGNNALENTTTASNNSAFGYLTLALSSGSGNSAFGQGALYTLASGNNNTAHGLNAGIYIADGSTSNSSANNSTYLGANTEAQASGDTNENVIGYAAVGHGSNTTTLGNASITDTYLSGNVHGTSASFAGTVVGGAVTNSGGVYFSGALITVSALATPTLLPGSGSSYGMLCIRDVTVGGTALFLIDPNVGVQLIGTSQITGLAATQVTYSGGNWHIALSSGSVPITFSWSIYD